MSSRGILRTRLLPPALPPNCLPRPALVETVLAGLDGRLVTVVAGAGYGKSTVLAQAVERCPHPWAWVSCDERMGDVGLLLGHVTAGLQERFPGFGAKLALSGPVADQVAQLCNEMLETVSDDVVLIFDDVHTLAGRSGDAALGLLIAQAPHQIRFLVASRHRLSMQVGRLRAERRLTEVGDGDLVLDEVECTALLRRWKVDLPKQTVADLHQRTEGWVAGLVLATQAAPPGEDGGGPPLTAGNHLFDYLAEEVVTRQTPDVHRFLLETSVLDRFTAALAGALTGQAAAAVVIDELMARHLFVIRLEGDDGWYRYHHLFREYLLQRADAEGLDRRALNLRAADAWRATGYAAEATRHYLAGGDPVSAADVLEPVADAMVHSPESESLEQWLAEIPPQILAERSALMLAGASILFLRAEWDAAVDALEEAVTGLLGIGDHDRAAAALFTLLRLHITTGVRRPTSATFARRQLPRIAETARMLPAVRLMMARAYGYRCRYREAEAELQAALTLAAAANLPAIDVYVDMTRAFMIDLPRGRIEEALQALDAGIAHLERHEERDVLAYLPYGHAWRGIVHVEAGDNDAALRDAALVEETAARRGLARVGAPVVAWLRFGALAGEGRWDELGAEIARTGPMFERLGPTVRGYHYPAALARSAAHRGDAATVATQIRATQEMLALHDYAYEEAAILSDLVAPASSVDLTELAGELAAQARAAARRARAPRVAIRAAMASAAADASSRSMYIADALTRTARTGFTDVWTRRHRELAAPLLGIALAGDLGPSTAAARLAVECGREVFAHCVASLGPGRARARLAALAGGASEIDTSELSSLTHDDDPAVRAAARRSQAEIEARPRPPIRIMTLGGLKVWRGDVLVPETAFKRRKARALLGALLCAEGPVHRDLLLEWFWPDLPATRGLAALYVTLHDLRRALEPGLAHGAASSLVVTDGQSYRVALSMGDTWDAAAFLDLAGGRQAELARLIEAERAYTGPLLPEWSYDAWSEGLRARVEEAHIGILERLAAALLEGGRAPEAVTRYRRLLSLDPERETWHRGLMDAYARSGELALALRQYQSCRARLRRGQGTEPSAETRALYARLLEAGGDGGGPAL